MSIAFNKELENIKEILNWTTFYFFILWKCLTSFCAGLKKKMPISLTATLESILS